MRTKSSCAVIELSMCITTNTQSKESTYLLSVSFYQLGGLVGVCPEIGRSGFDLGHTIDYKDGS